MINELEPKDNTQDQRIALDSVIPNLVSFDLDTTRHFYIEKLGFKLLFEYEGFIALVRDEVQLHFSKHADPDLARTNYISCYINVRNVTALYAAYQKEGVIHPNGALDKKPWGMLEFVVLDPDGNCLRFGEETEKSDR